MLTDCLQLATNHEHRHSTVLPLVCSTLAGWTVALGRVCRGKACQDGFIVRTKVDSHRCSPRMPDAAKGKDGRIDAANSADVSHSRLFRARMIKLTQPIVRSDCTRGSTGQDRRHLSHHMLHTKQGPQTTSRGPSYASRIRGRNRTAA